MAAEIQREMACSEFEALLSEALDGTLAEAGAERFAAHRQNCAACGPMFAEAEQGMKLLQGLEEVEPPRMMVHRILAATTGREPTRDVVAAGRPSWAERMRGYLPQALHPVLQARFGMSLAMAFFSLTIVFNLAGITSRDLRKADLRPTSLRDEAVRTYYETQARVVKYYENIRLVYEIESRVRDLRSAGEGKQQPKQQDDNKRDEKNKNINEKTSKRPDRDKQERYSFDFAGNVLAMLNAPASPQGQEGAR